MPMSRVAAWSGHSGFCRAAPRPTPSSGCRAATWTGSNPVKNQVPKLDLIPNCSLSPGLETDFYMGLPLKGIFACPLQFLLQTAEEGISHILVKKISKIHHQIHPAPRPPETLGPSLTRMTLSKGLSFTSLMFCTNQRDPSSPRTEPRPLQSSELKSEQQI